MSTQTTDTELKELLEKFSRNSIVLDISEEVPITKGWTRFGGWGGARNPDLVTRERRL